jgi:hypothetical protein
MSTAIGLREGVVAEEKKHQSQDNRDRNLASAATRRTTNAIIGIERAIHHDNAVRHGRDPVMFGGRGATIEQQ